MIDLREHKDLIRELVAKESEKDPNWKWSVKSIGKTVAHIRWGYLEYLDEKATFSITTESYDDCLGDTVTWRHPTGEMLSFASIGETYYGVTTTIESAITSAVKGIASYAHSRY